MGIVRIQAQRLVEVKLRPIVLTAEQPLRAESVMRCTAVVVQRDRPEGVAERLLERPFR